MPASHRSGRCSGRRALLRGLTATTLCAPFIAKQLYPAQFADIDPVEEPRKYHERYLSVAFEGNWMARLS